MLKVELNKENAKLVVKPIGRIDSVTAPEFDASFKTELTGLNELVFDLAELEYISSAGLRVLLSAVKTVGKSASISCINVIDDIKEVFEITGFNEILTIK